MQRRVFLGSLAAGALAAGRTSARAGSEGAHPPRRDRLRLVRRRRPRRRLQGGRRRGGGAVRRRQRAPREDRGEGDRGAGTGAADVQGLPAAARRGGPAGGGHRHPAPLARAALHRGLPAGPRRLLREAPRLRRARGPGDGGGGEGERARRPGGLPAATEPGGPEGAGVHRGGPRGEDRDRGRPDPLPGLGPAQGPEPGRPPGEPRLGRVVRPRPEAARTARRWGTSTGGSRRPTATGTSWTGASTGSTRSAPCSRSTPPARSRPRAASTRCAAASRRPTC